MPVPNSLPRTLSPEHAAKYKEEVLDSLQSLEAVVISPMFLMKLVTELGFAADRGGSAVVLFDALVLAMMTNGVTKAEVDGFLRAGNVLGRIEMTAAIVAQDHERADRAKDALNLDPTLGLNGAPSLMLAAKVREQQQQSGAQPPAAAPPPQPQVTKDPMLPQGIPAEIRDLITMLKSKGINVEVHEIGRDGDAGATSAERELNEMLESLDPNATKH